MEMKKLEKPIDKKIIKVAWMSNSPNIPTGYAKVTREVCSRLQNMPEFEVVVIGENYVGNPVQFQNYILHGKKPNETEIALTQRVLKETKADVLITLEDSFTLANQNYHQVKFNVPWINYIPLDGNYVPSTGNWILRNSDKIVAMSKYTQQALKNEGFDSKLIIHGVDLYDFRPSTESEKAQIRKKYGYKQDDILVGYFARNSMRKRNNRFLEACVLACIENPKLKVFCHIIGYNSRDLDVTDFLSRIMYLKYGRDMLKEGRILFNPRGENPMNALTDYEVAELLRMCDFTASATSGEGSGLLAPESFACGIPHITPNFTTGHEWILDEWDKNYGPRGLLCKYDGSDISSYNVEHCYADIKDLKNKIIELADNPELRKQMGKRARNFVEDVCDWNKLTLEWAKLIKEVV